MFNKKRLFFLAFSFFVGVSVAEASGGGVLPPPLDPRGAWFCCDSAGLCVHAVTVCGEGEYLVWCKNTYKDPVDGLTKCAD